jgi:hypothetical protein
MGICNQPMSDRVTRGSKMETLFVSHKTRDKKLVLSKIPFTLLAISQAPEGVFDQTLCQNLALDKARLSRFNGNII